MLVYALYDTPLTKDSQKAPSFSYEDEWLEVKLIFAIIFYA